MIASIRDETIAKHRPRPPVSWPRHGWFADVFKIGLGPSSSHTVGPMRAAAMFAASLVDKHADVAAVEVKLFGSLAWTGVGHATDRAVVLGLQGHAADAIEPDEAERAYAGVTAAKALRFPNGPVVSFDPATDICFDRETTTLPHPNTLTFTAFDALGSRLLSETWLSIGGGAVRRDDGTHGERGTPPDAPVAMPYAFADARTLLALGARHGLSIAELVMVNESAAIGEAAVLMRITEVAAAMESAVRRGLTKRGELAGGLKVQRRAADLYECYLRDRRNNRPRGNDGINLASICAIAVNEENAAGGRVVTAPTNGAAGVIPGVLQYLKHYGGGVTEAEIRTFFLTALTFACIIKQNASVSGAELGCQGEIGSAAAMAAGGLAAALGGTNEQCENAAEIALEHHLGMTCDPVGGLVQIPCIERNAFGAAKAISAASLALMGDGRHRVSFDEVVETMRQTGMDMQSRYKETSQEGLAVNVAAC